MKKRIVTINDYERLMSHRYYALLQAKTPEIVERFFMELMGAELIDQSIVPDDVVTMNSRVLLKEVNLGRQMELKLTYPNESNEQERRVGVFSAIGTALLGKRVGDVVSWKIHDKSVQFEILQVTYQPEAVGHFDL